MQKCLEPCSVKKFALAHEISQCGPFEVKLYSFPFSWKNAFKRSWSLICTATIVVCLWYMLFSL